MPASPDLPFSLPLFEHAVLMGDLATVTAMWPQAPATDQLNALGTAATHDRVAMVAFILPRVPPELTRTSVGQAFYQAGGEGAVNVLRCLLSCHPALLSEGLEGALQATPPQTASLEVLAPHGHDALWDEVLQELLENEDLHGLPPRACFARFECLVPWMTDATQHRLLAQHGEDVLPFMAGRVRARQRTQCAQACPHQAPSPPRRRS